MKNKKSFKLIEVGHKLGDITEFGKQLIESLGDDIFDIQNMQDLLFNILKQIYPINKSLKFNENSIEKACEKVIKNFGLNQKATLFLSTDSGMKEVKSEEKTNTEKFCQIIIQIDKVPGSFYKSLLPCVIDDLKSISDLINWYESQPCIQKYIKNDEIPKSHKERFVYDFYKRCINERIEIVNYQLYGLKKRAIAKSRYTPSWLTSIFAYSEMFYDKPYYYARPFSIHFFDYRRIDLVIHRIGDFYFAEAIKMQNLYEVNQSKFYNIYFKRTSVQHHFDNFKFYLPYLPLSKNRNLIFDEMIKLFRAKRWISFYALALPQVEGLFSEMCLAVSPEKDLSQKSLTQKVNSIRPFHNMSKSYFDYFQYHIPLQRNKFAHTGYDEDFKIKSYDLLVDLSHLLKIFYELDNPLVKIKKLHVRRNHEDFISLKEFVDYFKLLNELKPQQKKEIHKDIVVFEKEFLSLNCSVDFICFEMMQNLPRKLEDFTNSIKARFEPSCRSLDLNKLNTQDIDNLLDNQNNFEIMEGCFIYKDDIIEELENCSIFLREYKKYMPNLKQEIKDELKKFQMEVGLILKCILHTNNKIENRKIEEK